MGQLCAKLRNPDYIAQSEETYARSPFFEIDNVSVPAYPETSLKFYSDIEDKFCVLKKFLLVDYMNLLNGYKRDEDAAGSPISNFRSQYLTKEEYKTFIQNKILRNPIAKTTLKAEDFQTFSNENLAFLDDICDKINSYYSQDYQLDPDNERPLPKICFFSIGFNYCYSKLSQKLIILMNMFADKENKISYSDEFHLFCHLIFSNAFEGPIKYLSALSADLIPRESLLAKIQFSEREKFESIDSGAIFETALNLGDDLVDSLFAEGEQRLKTKTYTKEEFKKIVLGENFIWIFSNKGIKMKVEQYLKEKSLIR